MKTVELVIKLPKFDYEQIKHGWNSNIQTKGGIDAIRNGTVLPKGHGKLIDKNEYFKGNFNDAREFLDRATTIIEADREEKDNG